MNERIVIDPSICHGKPVIRGTRTPVSTVLGHLAAGDSFETLRREYDLSDEDIRAAVAFDNEELARLTFVADKAHQKLIETDRLRSALAQIIPENRVGEWLRTPNPAFEGQTPIQVIERGESDRIWQMVFQIDANVAT